MKIKYLKIRNIASIESGDIDFENGLTDHESGLPSTLFLITGDTGSGKSVILDCISMALYGTTPRVRGVNGIRNNTYTNNEGEEISINDIRQYTRIGISWKEDCFAELSFTGNDGIEYVSTFSLGRTSHRNYRDPSWKLRIGDSTEISNRKDEIRDTIQNAVGLTFEQFSRMAMLAQGQFATFLTGKKEERERILEQLTSTDIFSRYGEAISNIFKRSKQDKETAGKVYEEFGKKILTEEARQQLISDQEIKQQSASTLRMETERLRQRITHSEAAIKAEKDISSLKEEFNELKSEEESPDFKKRSALIDLWDKTEQERKLTADKIDLDKSIASDTRTLQELKAEFTLLSADLSTRKEAAKVRTLILEEERKWIETKEALLPIFENSSVMILNIKHYIDFLKETEQKTKSVKEEKALIDDLRKEVDSLEKTVTEKAKACEDCRLTVKQKSEERDALNPSELRKTIERLLNRKHSLKDFSDSYAKVEIEKDETKKAVTDLDAAQRLHAELKEAAEKSITQREIAEKELKRAEDRYMTMHLSLDRNFKELRRKLSEENATNCPLCGQSITEHIDEWSKEAYFSDLLSPLEIEKNRLLDAYAIAKKKAEEDERKFNTSSGSLKAMESELKKRKKNLAISEADINERLKSLELTGVSDLAISIAKEISTMESEISGISEKLALAEKIQKEIDVLLKQKEILDKQLREEEYLLQTAVKKLTEKKEGVRNSEIRIGELKSEISRLCKNITEDLTGYSDDWTSDPEAVASRLRKDAEEYSSRSSKHAKEVTEHNALLKGLESLTASREQLSELLSNIDEEAHGILSFSVESLKLETLQKKWNDFLIEVSTAVRRRIDNESKIKEIIRKLNEYCQSTGITETTLRQLLNAAKDVNEARILLQKHRDALNKNTAFMTEAIRSRDENLKVLEIEDVSQLEDLEQVKSLMTENDRLHTELSQQIGVIKERLDADAKTRKDSELQRKDLEQKTLRFEKWEKMNRYFGGTRFRTLVQSHILRPLLNNANIYLRQITDHYTLTCSDENEQLSILVLDRYHNNEPRSVTVLSGGERFMISLALSLALSAMNRPDLNVDILFIDEGFGTLDAKSLEMVMSTLRRLPEINGQTGRRVGVISHREELTEQIPTQIQLQPSGHGRSRIVISNS